MGFPYGSCPKNSILKAIEEDFEIDKEVICFRNLEEAVERIKYYLSHDEEREETARRGMQRAREDHTWQKRWNEILEVINGRESTP